LAHNFISLAWLQINSTKTVYPGDHSKWDEGVLGFRVFNLCELMVSVEFTFTSAYTKSNALLLSYGSLLLRNRPQLLPPPFQAYDMSPAKSLGLQSITNQG
jgi:hypothetical protein